MKEELRKTVEDNMATDSEGIRDFIRMSALQRLEDIKHYFSNVVYILINKYLEGDEFYEKNALNAVRRLAYSENFFSELSDDTKETLSMILSLEHDEEDFELPVESTRCSSALISIK